MKISELIAELKMVQEEQGDLEIYMRNMDWNTLCHLKLKLKGDDYGHLQVVVEPAP